MNITFNQLQVLLKIRETGSVTKAAEALHLTQPAVSIQLRNLQDQFDVPLTEVVGRKIYITDFGNQIAQAAAEIAEQVHAIHYLSLAAKGQLTGRIRISVVSTGKYVMPYFLSGFLARHPGIELAMDVTNKAQVIDSLERNEVDFSLVSIKPDHLRVEQLELMENRLVLVGTNDTPPPEDGPGVPSLPDAPLIFREKGSGTRQTMETFLKQHGLTTTKTMELTSNEAVKQAVLAGLGISIMPVIGIRNELKDGRLKIIPFPGLPLTTTWTLIWQKGKNHSPAVTALLNQIEATKDEVIRTCFQ